MSESEVNQQDTWARTSIFLATAVRGGYSPSFRRATRQLEAWCAEVGIPFDTQEVVEAPIDAARDVLAAAYLTAKTPAGGPFSHCLMIDAGVGFSVETIQKLLLADVPFTAAAVPLRRYNLDKIAADGQVAGGSTFAVKLTQKTRETGRPTLASKGGATFMEVDGIGAALICVRREVFLRVFESHPELQHAEGFGYFLPTLMTADGESHATLMRTALQTLRREQDPTTRLRIIEDALSVDPRLFDRTGEDIAFCTRWRRMHTDATPAEIWLLVDAPLIHEGHGYFTGNFSDQLTGS